MCRVSCAVIPRVTGAALQAGKSGLTRSTVPACEPAATAVLLALLKIEPSFWPVELDMLVREMVVREMVVRGGVQGSKLKLVRRD
jgi:hypothetical protein